MLARMSMCSTSLHSLWWTIASQRPQLASTDERLSPTAQVRCFAVCIRYLLLITAIIIIITRTISSINHLQWLPPLTLQLFTCNRPPIPGISPKWVSLLFFVILWPVETVDKKSILPISRNAPKLIFAAMYSFKNFPGAPHHPRFKGRGRDGRERRREEGKGRRGKKGKGKGKGGRRRRMGIAHPLFSA